MVQDLWFRRAAAAQRCHSLSIALSLTHTHPHANTHTHTHTHIYTHTHTHPHTHTHTHISLMCLRPHMRTLWPNVNFAIFQLGRLSMENSRKYTSLSGLLR